MKKRAASKRPPVDYHPYEEDFILIL